MDVYKPVYPGLYYFDTFTFTTLGTSGHRGPDSTKTYANAPWNADQFSIVDGQQQWTVPATGTYLIEAAGAYSAKKGRVVSGDVILNEGQVVSLLVGQTPFPSGSGLGGGGGTFIVSDKPLIVASGGDGTGGQDGSFSPYGSGNGINGAGYFSDGSNVSIIYQFLKPTAYINGGFGNSFEGLLPYSGGFGGGQGFVYPPTSIYGGGGYTGSPGDGVSGATCYGAGTITDLGATSNSAGYVTVSLVDPAPITQVYDDTILSTEIYASPSGFAYWSDIVYSPELNIFVAPSYFYNGQGIVYSTDGKQWFRSDYSGSGPWCVGWSPELGIFISGRNNVTYTSSNGKNWTQSVGTEIGFAFGDVIWVPFLHKFIGIYIGFGPTISYLYESSDGINWYPIETGPLIYYWYIVQTVFAASPDTVIAGVYSSVYLSTDGINWETSLTTSGDIRTTAYGNGIFLVVTDAFYYYYSNDKGQTWSNGILPYTNIAPLYYTYFSSVFTDSLAIVTGNHETFVSTDCVSWERYPNNTMSYQNGGYHSAVYNPEGQYIVAVSDREINLSLDGTLWIPADTTFIGAPYDNVAYSPETNTVVAVASNSGTSNETGVYTKDGVNWKRIPGLSFYPTSCRWNPLQNLFFLDNYAFDPISETLSSGSISYREWIESTTPPQLLQSYYQQGLNNNLPIGKAFSLGGIIVNTGANVYGGERVSCSGDVFIKMARYNNGTAYRSTDGTNWESYQIQGDAFDCTRIIYVSKYKAFFVLSSQQVHKSYDGVSWSMVYQSPGIYLSEMIWCSTTNKILLFSIANNLTELTFSN
jgi:hypothetical protein